jgi:hypothetical protein
LGLGGFGLWRVHWLYHSHAMNIETFRSEVFLAEATFY